MRRFLGVWSLVLFILLGVSQPSFAADKPDKCKNVTFEASQFFKEVQDEAIAINTAFCETLNIPVSENLLRRRVADFAISTHEAVSGKLSGTKLNKIQEQFAFFTQHVAGGELHPLAMPIFVVLPPVSVDKNPTYFFNGNQGSMGELTQEIDYSCTDDFNAKCVDVLNDLANAIFPYQQYYNAMKAEQTAVELDALSKRWDAYFDEGRSLTTLDLMLTTYLERKHLQTGHLVGPPVRQWFLLHPDVVMEYVGSARDGEQFEAGLSLEWAGVNWWEDSWLGVPFGFSVTSIYIDRAEIADVGHGLTLHFDNVYSLGWVRRGSEDGIFVSLNLLNAFKEREEKVKAFKKQYIQ